MNYRNALDFIYSFSDFERNGTFSRTEDPQFTRFRALMRLLNNPQNTYPAIHIAGTKGKGSVSALIESALRANDYQTGLYTSPDLHTMRERIRIQGQPISEEETCELAEEVQAAIARMPEALSSALITFEIITAMAFLAFAKRHVTIAIIETGLGGRLDPTNSIQPLLCIITSISYDHMAVLGKTIRQIAREKAGIIKDNGVVIVSAEHPEALEVIDKTAKDHAAQIIHIASASNKTFDPQIYTYPEQEYTIYKENGRFYQEFQITHTGQSIPCKVPLLGAHQRQNTCAALAAIHTLDVKGFPVKADRTALGFAAVQWPARLQLAGENPLIFIDGAHNADSLQKTLQTISKDIPYRRMHILLGTLKDKDIAGMAQVLQQEQVRLHSLVICGGFSPRAAPAELWQEHLANELTAAQINIQFTDSFETALLMAEEIAQPEDLVLITGSLYLAAAALLRIAATRKDPVAASITIYGQDHV